MASPLTLKLEVELRMYAVKKNDSWRWWKFWQKKEIRVLTSYDDMEDDLTKLQPVQRDLE